MKYWIVIAAISGAMCVMLGAFASHGLKSIVSAQRLDVFHTAVDYQFYHSLALMLVAVLRHHYNSLERQLCQVAGLFCAGILLFSGSLYTLVLTDTPWLGAITPFGGSAFIIGWLYLALSVLRNEK